MYRLTVWANPTNDMNRGHDHPGTLERTIPEVRHSSTVLEYPIHAWVEQLARGSAECVGDRSSYSHSHDGTLQKSRGTL